MKGGATNLQMMPHVWHVEDVLNLVDMSDACHSSSLFGTLCWRIWKQRNPVVFQEQHFFSEDILMQSVSWAAAYRQGSQNPNTWIHRQLLQVGWKLPPTGWVKLNTDATVERSSLRASIGGLLRGNYGSWIVGFCKNVGVCSVQKAELWSIMEGLQLAWSKGIRRLIVENDIKTIIHMLNGNETSTNPCGTVRGIGEVCRRKWEIKFERIYREAIKDFLSKLS
ncbi:hypothetical protein Goarm_018552 [Gossypium armourianum]|uniref:RNase H type-1 domain-containing protein n=1 Tax=Gossypium armourianum TaxID=34283 RepID=A0A7J9IHX3_9ROSI|nr:hypothetical protein [Gossypium armourianum]